MAEYSVKLKVYGNGEHICKKCFHYAVCTYQKENNPIIECSHFIELPPHGDLVDRDEMREIAIALLDEAVTDQEANTIREMWSRLGKMPVYIPAEEG